MGMRQEECRSGRVGKERTVTQVWRVKSKAFKELATLAWLYVLFCLFCYAILYGEGWVTLFLLLFGPFARITVCCISAIPVNMRRGSRYWYITGTARYDIDDIAKEVLHL